LDRLEELAKRFSSVAPDVMEHIAQHPELPQWDECLSRLSHSWAWRQANLWLDEFLRSNEKDVAAELDRLQQSIGETKARLAAALAWRGCLGRLTEEHRRHLKAWEEAVRKVGKGTGKYAPKHRRDARAHMQECRSAIPAWIMPLYRVVESVEPVEEAFDAVIIDEASQSASSDVLFLFYLAKKIIVVGDEEQISPVAAGIERGMIHSLNDRYIADVPCRELIGPDTSFFALADVVIGGRIVLREHFRCMPEIIGFSNQLCYKNKPLEPLRQYPAKRLKPVVTTHVPDGYREGTGQNSVNPPEAEAIVNTIHKLCCDPAYKDKSVGVISLLGEGQAHLIERLLLEAIGPEQIAERNLVCGDAYAFQGNERDIMFLSMVAAPGEVSMRALTNRNDQQRFNVAASRAKDQLWLFHTPTVNDFRNKECLRFRLLSYCLNPNRLCWQVTNDKCESEFEKEVYDQITARGFRVIPQYEVAGYRIDLVVEGTASKLAVECDGDVWHGAERFDDDMRRQRILERCGWSFCRVWGSNFYRDPERALKPLWGELDRLGIRPWTDEHATAMPGNGTYEAALLSDQVQATPPGAATKSDDQKPHTGEKEPSTSERHEESERTTKQSTRATHPTKERILCKNYKEAKRLRKQMPDPEAWGIVANRWEVYIYRTKSGKRGQDRLF